MLSLELLVLSIFATLPAAVVSTPHDFNSHHNRQFNPRDYVTPAQRSSSYDFVVAGGGLAGLVLASRLSDDSSKTVLVLEAGASGDALASNIDTPADTYYTSILDQPGYSWGYATVPQTNAGGRSMTQPRGRVLGGSAAVNGMYIVRPPSTQVNAWHDLIASDDASSASPWAWDSFFAAFKNAETFTPPTSDAASTAGMKYSESSLGTAGPLHVTYPGYMVPVTGSWLPTLSAVGVSVNPDGYSGDNVGGFFALSAINPANWTRSYSKSAWIDPLPPRSNLHIISSATVEQIVFANDLVNGQRHASSVRFSNGKGTEVFEVAVNKEVILSGGAMGTPHMLLVSGVGPKDVLDAAGVPVQAELPGVGQHMLDHLAVGVYFEANTDTQGSIRASGSDLSKTPEFKSFINSGVAYINGSLLFESTENLNAFRASISSALDASASSLVPSQYDEVKEGYKAISQANVDKVLPGDGLIEVLLSINAEKQIAVQAALQVPMSHGRIYINSSSIYDPLLIDPQYFSHPADMVVLRQGVKLARRIAGTAPLKDGLGAEVTPGPDVQSDAQIEDWIRASANTEYHPGCTAAMLPRNKGGVVDAKLKVYGLANVRVVDSSVFPLSFSAHLMAPTYALAEQAATIIANDYSTTPTNNNSATTSGAASPSSTDPGKNAASALSSAKFGYFGLFLSTLFLVLL